MRCIWVRNVSYPAARTLRALSLVLTRYAVPAGLLPSDATPRSMSCFASATLAAARLMVGRILYAAWGRATLLLKYGLGWVGLQLLAQ